MAKLMRCHTPHWQGNTFVNTGTVLPEGDRGVIPIYFEAFIVADPEPEPASAEVKRGPGRPRKTAP
jgi:hypothetical protein